MAGRRGIPRAAGLRLSLYLRQLQDCQRARKTTISSQELAAELGLTDAQVRRDLGYCGQFGHPGVGYKVEQLVSSLRRILGTDRTWSTAIVGAGNLGSALARFQGFEQQGFRVVALFDKDPRRIGQRVGALEVRAVSELARAVKKEGIRLAIITVPAAAAQEVADVLAAAGIRGVLNFAPRPVNLPRHVAHSSVDLAMQLEQLSFKVESVERQAP